MTNKKKIKIPRYCWHCSRKLQGAHFDTLLIYNEVRVLHKQCKEDILENNPYLDGVIGEEDQN